MRSATTDNQAPIEALEQEVHQLEDSNDALDQRAGNLEMKSGFVVLFTFFALAVAVAALVVALVGSGKATTKTVVERVPAAAATPAAAPVAPGSVSVKLGEMFVKPSASQATAGKVTFNVTNTGKLVHEMIVGRAPIKGPLATGKMSEATSVGEVAELKPGTSGHVQLDLKPGTYVLFCNVPGHYAAGQHTVFRVTKG